MKRFFIVFFALFMTISNVSFAKEVVNVQNKEIVFEEDELKFYQNNKMLTQDELKVLFPEYKILLISEFDKNKKYTMKNSIFKSKKILLLNDTNRTFHNFFIYPESSRVMNEKIKSLITVYGKKNVRLKHFGGDEFEIVVK